MLQKVLSYRQVPLLVGFVITLLGGAQSVDAATIIVNFSSTDLLSTGQFQGFDPALGILNSVDINATATESVTFTKTGTAGNLTGRVNFDVSFFSDALELIDTEMATPFLAPGETFSLTATDSGSVLRTTGLSSFLSAGLISLPPDVGSFVGFGIMGGGSGQVTFTLLSGTVTYDYTPTSVPVPEPASVLLLGTGLAGAGLRRWRQKRA